jgi:TRAP-type C4-dicarboxylate transport system permease small subunit
MRNDNEFNRHERLADAIACAFLFAVIVLTTVDVISRNVFNQPVPGATEITEIGLAAIVFFSFPQLAYRHGHIVVDLFDSFTNETVRKVQRVVSAWLGALTFLGLAWQLHLFAMRAFENGDATIQLGIPYAPVLWVMALVSFASAVAFWMGAREAQVPERSDSLQSEAVC